MEKVFHSFQSKHHPSTRANFSTRPHHELNRYHFRKQRGVNLGSWFVLERWITDTPFQSARHPAQSDLDVALGKNAKNILKHHWDTWIQEGDWDWIRERCINSVRIPVGYYHLCGVDGSVLRGTDFEPHHHIYEGAWKHITWAIEEASKRAIGVLIDLHAVPGKQNHDAHAGTSGQCNFFGDVYNRNKTMHVLLSLVNALNKFTVSHNPPLQNIIGIELVNEPDANPAHDQTLKDWYANTMHEIRKIDHTIPLYIGECWRPDSFSDFVTNLPSELKSGPVILDHHLYRCFTASDTRTSVQKHIHELETTTAPHFARLNEKLGCSGSGLIIGEWSGGLNEGSLTGTPNERRAYIDAQLRLLEEHCGGWFFWTYKKDDEDVGWSMRGAVAQGAISESLGFRRVDETLKEFQTGEAEAHGRALSDAYQRHVDYWSKIPGRYQHAFFQKGYIMGWSEAVKFITSTAESSRTIDQIGFKSALARFLAPSEVEGHHYWEYEHGFIQGATGAEKDYAWRVAII